MRRVTLIAGALVLLMLAVAAVGLVWARAYWLEVYSAGPQESGETLFVVERGQGANTILRNLAEQGVITDERRARLFLRLRRQGAVFQAGEYRFTHPLSTVEVIDKLMAGEVILHPVQLVEGLTLMETADRLAQQGWWHRDELLQLMQDPSLISDLDPRATNLEGYLYPDTYHFGASATAGDVVGKLVATFRLRWQQVLDEVAEVAGEAPEELTTRDLVTLASLVEMEAQLDHERPLIAAVYANRLRRGMGLYADPTIIYALKQMGVWNGNLTRRDLEMDSPYNTYRVPGLPPTPICSPSVKSLRAALRPATSNDLFFVSRNDGSHVFSETLAEHNRNVERWQRQYWRNRRARSQD